MSREKVASSPAMHLAPRTALLAVGFLFALSAAAQYPAGCATATATTSAFPLGLDTSVTSAKGSDEWNSDVIRIAVQEPGLLLVSAEGPEVQGLIYGSATGDPLLLDAAGIGTAGRVLALIVDPGDYCVQIAPPGGTVGAVRVRADLIDVTMPTPE